MTDPTSAPASAETSQGDDAAEAATFPASIAAVLRREILTGALVPGSPIKERDHAERLGVSRTPLREAVRILAKEGLVTLRPLRTPLVTDLSRNEALDELAVLRLLELHGGELACAHVTDDEIASIAALAQTVEENHAKGDALEVFDLDMQMHRAIVAAGHNPALTRSYEEHLARLWRIRFLSARQRSDAPRVLADHRGIVDALSARDSARMQRFMASHMDNLANNVNRHFDELDELDGA